MPRSTRAFSWAARILLGFTIMSGCGLEPVPAARPATIYGDDDRHELFELPKDSILRLAGRAVALLVDRSSLQPVGKDGQEFAYRETFASSMARSGRPLCSAERFQDEPLIDGLCSAFLVGPKLLATAGHCIDAGSCEYVAFVFGFAYESAGDELRQARPDEVYYCRNIVVREQERGGADFALVELDRPVRGRQALPFRQSGEVLGSEELVLVGHPLGLPAKIAPHGQLLEGGANTLYFRAAVDAYGGASGSLVWGLHSGLVEGLLVRGEDDFVEDDTRGCWRSRVCGLVAPQPCRGEFILRATVWAPYLRGMPEES